MVSNVASIFIFWNRRFFHNRTFHKKRQKPELLTSIAFTVSGKSSTAKEIRQTIDHSWMDILLRRVLERNLKTDLLKIWPDTRPPCLFFPGFGLFLYPNLNPYPKTRLLPGSSLLIYTKNILPLRYYTKKVFFYSI